MMLPRTATTHLRVQQVDEEDAAERHAEVELRERQQHGS
jgi:hypothetical protein